MLFRFPGHEKVRMVRSPLGEIPEEWKIEPLESLIDNYIGGGWGKESTDESHVQPAYVIRGTDIPDVRTSKLSEVPFRYHTISNIQSRRLFSGDIIFEVSGGSKGQPVGRTLLITPELLSAFDRDVICASFCKRIQPNDEKYGSELLYVSFLEGYDSGEIEQYQVQSTGISNFKWAEYIKNIHRVVPPESLRMRFREHVIPLFNCIVTLGLQIQNLRKTRDLLLPRFLSNDQLVRT